MTWLRTWKWTLVASAGAVICVVALFTDNLLFTPIGLLLSASGLVGAWIEWGAWIEYGREDKRTVWQSSSEWWVAQLVAINDEGEVLTKWEPIRCASRDEADLTATRLMMDNQWGSPGRWPDTRVYRDTGVFDGN